MFNSLISSFLDIVQNLINTIVSNNLLSYVFYIGILGFIIHVILYIYSFNNSDISSRR